MSAIPQKAITVGIETAKSINVNPGEWRRCRLRCKVVAAVIASLPLAERAALAKGTDRDMYALSGQIMAGVGCLKLSFEDHMGLNDQLMKEFPGRNVPAIPSPKFIRTCLGAKAEAPAPEIEKPKAKKAKSGPPIGKKK